ncbi:diacylglycerol O-acyltransferase [Powellomyces hirtus]|uniref:Diacylglycerol O-acyltransferase n=1 Tax=Powellomyces hirtus TaxID=109895 RepID=A0A507ECF8_9FUNG|nr:diacylglycerol O-acyltransferase [Powellomyces hirtus]
MPPHSADFSMERRKVAEPVALPPTEFLTGRDNMFLTVEDEFHYMNVSGLYYFPAAMTAEEMKGHISAFANQFSRCRQKLVRPPGLFDRPYWVADTDYTIDNHFTRVQLPAPATDLELMDVAGPLHAAELDKSKPLWHCYWFDGLDGGNKKAILFVAHHAIADGQGFVRSLLTFVAAQDPTIADVRKLQYSAGRHSPSPVACQNAKKPETQLTLATRTTNAVTSQAVGILVFLAALLSYAFNYILLVVIPRTSYTSNTKTTKKQVAWTTTHIPLDKVKAIKNRYGVTVNDVLTACVGSAMGSQLPADKQDPRLWLLIPTSMRHPDDLSASNKTSGYILGVPNGARFDIGQRIRGVNSCMRTAKGSPEAVLNYSSLELMYRYPNAFPKFFLRGANFLTGVLTNVPGANTPLTWGQHEIKDMIALIPQAGPNSVSCAVYTYHGAVTLSVHMDHMPGHEVFGDGAAKSIILAFEKAIDAAYVHSQALAIEQGYAYKEVKKIQ